MSSINQLNTFLQILQNGHHIRIISHRNPDGDAIGSMLAFAHICEHYKLNYDIILIDPVPKNLLFIVENININYLNSTQIDEIQNEQTDIIAFLDCGQSDRAGSLCDYILPHQKIINIDHHMSNPLFGDFNCVLDISSTCELLYNIIKKLNIPLTQKIATAIYVGILTDTGLFQYNKVTAQTHQVLAHLMEFDIDHFKIYQNIYQTHPISWIPLLKKGIENLELFDNNTIAIMSFSYHDISMAKDGFDDTHILFPIMLSTKSIRVCAILKEKEDNIISVSLRSKDQINVAEIAQVFDGGGHIRAAGCRSSKYSLQEFKKNIYIEIKKHL
ncbi:MAG: bifunctional oligoribonuclease/PAP phosphatase NrnA [Spirochaetota bacterium]|nr:bifunctional oligoribonuclease/PAP phosphatase NrnA [Spirochaetota bacterium]